MKIMAVDYGDARTGLAVCDRTETLASPVGMIEEKSMAKVAEKIVYASREYEVGMIVLGLPKNMDGSEGPRCQSIRQFAANIARHGPPALAALPILFQDERLSTAAVTRGMIDDYDMSRAKRAERIDSAAAAVILQGAIDALAGAAF